jgi:hypothetical protein
MYYLQSRYYDPSIGRFINADGYITTGQGVLSYNMFAYCLNNPVMYSDSSGEWPTLEDVLEFGKDVVDAASTIVGNIWDGISGGTEELIYDIKGKDSIEITNSHTVWNPFAMYRFITENRGDEVSGSTCGIMYEWYIHNITYIVGIGAYYTGLDPTAEIIKSSADLNFGSTIYDDTSHGVFSAAMIYGYVFLFPRTAIGDLIAELKEEKEDEKQS